MGKNTGGPAFPYVANEDWKEVCYGMTLRDYFAAKATEGDIAAHMYCLDEAGNVRDRTREQAKFTYADAMIAARGSDMEDAKRWKEYAQHLEYCATCGESVHYCSIGTELRNAAMRQEEK